MTPGGPAAATRLPSGLTFGAKDERTWLCCFWLFFLQPPVGLCAEEALLIFPRIRAHLKRKKVDTVTLLIDSFCENFSFWKPVSTSQPAVPPAVRWGRSRRRLGSPEGQSLGTWGPAFLRQHVWSFGCLFLNRTGQSACHHVTIAAPRPKPLAAPGPATAQRPRPADGSCRRGFSSAARSATDSGLASAALWRRQRALCKQRFAGKMQQVLTERRPQVLWPRAR